MMILKLFHVLVWVIIQIILIQDCLHFKGLLDRLLFGILIAHAHMFLVLVLLLLFIMYLSTGFLNVISLTPVL